MSHDATPAKYFAYLNFFIFNMLLLVLGANMVVMFVGWEGVGLCSYLLIGYWFSDKEKAAAGMKAFITNRIGDAGFYWEFSRCSSRSARWISPSSSACCRPRPKSAGRDRSRLRACFCLSGRPENPPRSLSTCGFPTRWRVRPRCRRSSTRRPW